MANPAVAVKTTKVIHPKIYAFTMPGVKYHEGWIKIGYTEQGVKKRIDEITRTIGIIAQLEWQGNAFFEDDDQTKFRDTDFHAFLRKHGVKQKKIPTGKKPLELLKISPKKSKECFNIFRENPSVLRTLDGLSSYVLREEQQDAVAKTVAYWKVHKNGEFLWNAKPRFGKTLTSYDFCKQIDAKNVLIVTNRPAIADSWFNDYTQFLGKESGYLFVSNVDILQNDLGVLSRQKYLEELKKAPESKCIEFVSLQDLKGSIYFGGKFKKLEEIKDTKWDLLIIDEAHEGVDTYKTDVAFDHIERKFTLHLSGTPFKALANEKFSSDAIYNWTYADEQEMKDKWHETGEEENPYAVLPKLNLFTYKMSDIISEELQKGMELNGETVEYAFDLNEFFKVNNRSRFEHDEAIDTFLDALTQQKKFPFSTEELRDELKHTFWILNRVDSAKALAKKLKDHPVFKDYEIILAAGDGKLDDDEENQKSLEKVKSSIKKYDKTITISVGQLTTGITIKEWTAVLMLSNMKSPALYMQAAFRAQNPHVFTKEGNVFERKENAYVFDFDPARTLMIYEGFANDLSANTAGGHGDSDSRKQNVNKLLNFFPVIGEDEDGEMIELDAEQVLSIPRKIRSLEVVRRGFMSDFLFQNISHVFAAPEEVIDIIQNFQPIHEPKEPIRISGETAKQLSLDEKGDVSLTDEYVIGKSKDIFGDKIYEPEVKYTSEETIKNVIKSIKADNKPNEAVEKFKDFMHDTVVKSLVIDPALNIYGNDLNSVKKKIERKLKTESDIIVKKKVDAYKIQCNILETDRTEALQNRYISGESAKEIHKRFDQLHEKVANEYREELNAVITEFVTKARDNVVRTVETNKLETEKNEIETCIRDHLRGFSRSIPSFLMAYGNENVTLKTFDKIIPENVFRDVTSISLNDFLFLRDGGDYTDKKTGQIKHFEGNLFDPVVFDDSVKEFMSLRRKLANYFDDNITEDIFDYIPPQKTNQIFTPKDIVIKMVDMLEKENPGCFDNPDFTFIDLYMKSGLYITEIVKRLYRSQKMKELYPNKKDRLQHIFEKQVYGLAPTEIIYRIATNFILGFSANIENIKHNFRCLDALPYAKDGTLSEKLDKLFGADKD